MNILVVDDSAFMRKIVTDLLERMPNIHVSNTARNGQHALKLLAEALKPDLVLLDVEMPVLNGLETLKEIKRLYDIPVVMLSALSNKDITIEALTLGAADFVEKPINIREIQDEWIQDFYGKIKNIPTQRRRPVRRTERVERTEEPPVLKERSLPSRIQALVIGASTGGPKALLRISKALPASLKVPIFIVQHMPKGFTTSFAQRMNDESAAPVKEAQDGMSIEKCVYLCPGDYHMTLRQGKIVLNQEAKVHGTRPAVDYLFESAAQMYRRELVAVLLTGMGKDGSEGMREIQRLGGYTIAQDKETSVVFGMPRQAILSGVVNEVLSLDDIGAKVKQMVR
ncbi:protein-glutamate methylesterase/protein-glutamine glutaminase [Enterococcus olivae]